ncbi:MAG: hypothetical protein NTU79_14635 [Planctomycetota bacterium]|nr:hypothetical protein [Planctomycetota bacterium]
MTVIRKQSDGDVVQIGLMRDQISTLLRFDIIASGTLIISEWGLEVCWLDDAVILHYKDRLLKIEA